MWVCVGWLWMDVGVYVYIEPVLAPPAVFIMCVYLFGLAGVYGRVCDNG